MKLKFHRSSCCVSAYKEKEPFKHIRVKWEMNENNKHNFLSILFEN